MTTSAPPNVAVLIPTFNNAVTLADAIEGALKHVETVLVVNDGSTDATRDVIEGFSGRIEVHTHPVNRGKGVALRHGFEVLAGKGFSYAISMDADGQHFAEDLPRFVEAIRAKPGSLAVGERDMDEAGAPRRSLFGLWFSNLSLRVLGGVRLKDSQAGFRAYPLAGVSDLGLRGTRFDLELEVLIKAARRGIPLVAVPIHCSYSPQGGRVSHFRPVRDFCQIGGRVLRLMFSR